METRDIIIAEGSKQFLKYGIKGVTMDDIAKSLSMSKRTIYENFRDKNELLRSCMDRILSEQYEDSEKIIYNTGNVIETIFEVIQYGIRALRTINPLFELDLKKFHFQLWMEVKQKSDEVRFNQIYRLLRKGINENLFRKNINVEVVSKIFLGQLSILSDDQTFPKDKFEMEVVFENMVINFARGIATAKGIELIDSFSE